VFLKVLGKNSTNPRFFLAAKLNSNHLKRLFINKLEKNQGSGQLIVSCYWPFYCPPYETEGHTFGSLKN